MTAIDMCSLTRTITQTVDVEMGTAGTPEPVGRKPEIFSRRFSSTMFSEEDKERLRKGPRDWWTDFRAGIHMEDGIRQYHTARSQAHHKWWIKRQSELAEQERREEERSNTWYRAENR
jgi:hypothetical protein